METETLTAAAAEYGVNPDTLRNFMRYALSAHVEAGVVPTQESVGECMRRFVALSEHMANVITGPPSAERDELVRSIGEAVHARANEGE